MVWCQFFPSLRHFYIAIVAASQQRHALANALCIAKKLSRPIVSVIFHGICHLNVLSLLNFHIEQVNFRSISIHSGCLELHYL